MPQSGIKFQIFICMSFTRKYCSPIYVYMVNESDFRGNYVSISILAIFAVAMAISNCIFLALQIAKNDD